VVAGKVKTALGVAACERDAEKLELIEELTKGFDAVQETVLAAILERNNGAEYLRRHGMEGRTDRDAFKARVPVVTYEDLRPEIERIANGDRSNIISSHPITEFLTRPVHLCMILSFLLSPLSPLRALASYLPIDSNSVVCILLSLRLRRVIV
jgi:hypothetical protein